jgi:hypothetical protein
MGSVSVISNISPTTSKLRSLLADETNQHDGAHANGEPSGSPSSQDLSPETKIDISLRMPISSPPSILLLFNTREEASIIAINVEIGLNGQINVSNVSGPWDSIDHDSTDSGLTRDPRTESQELRDKLTKVLETCEDLGLLIEWVLRWMRQQKSGPA